MKVLATLLLIGIWSPDPSEITKKNKLKKSAEKAYANGNYELAAGNYSILFDTLGVNNPAIGLNLAHSYFALGDSANARIMYQNVATSNNRQLKSIAYQQLGIMSKKQKALKESLQYLKSALKADPSNEGARYDYEVVKKLMDREAQSQKNQNQNQSQKNQDQSQENQDQENQDRQDQEKQNQEEEQSKDQQQQDDQKEEKDEQRQQNKDGEQEQREEDKKQPPRPDTEQKLEEMNISEEKAKMILEAMKNNEIQYIQQQKRKATKPHDRGKPDW